MLELHLDAQEFFDSENNMFIRTKPITVKLAHSLISLSKWEGIWQKPFLPSFQHKGMGGYREEVSYINCMLIKSAPDHVPTTLHANHQTEINAYINDNQTATRINRDKSISRVTPTVTAELIYYWMIRFGIPYEFEKWHLNRLLTLIDVCNVNESKDQKGSRMTPQEAAIQRAKINEQRMREMQGG